MRIGGLLKTSLIDYPGLISAVIFTQGCNFRCPYCHNPELVDPSQFTTQIQVEEILDFLKKRRGLLDGVVVTGGEPTLYDDLPLLLSDIKQLGYRIKLDTNGTYPDRVAQVIDEKLVDFVAMDIKGPMDRYREVTGAENCSDRILKSIEILGASIVNVEFRTTVIKSLHSEADIIKICNLVPSGKRFVLQRFEPSKTLDITYLNKSSLPDISISRLETIFKQEAINYAVR